ncbi:MULTISPECIES: ROK family transcriptional regulator [Cetobacterium]|uniref:ROK family protein n=1 Tax=Candidatus Cetobacterium colombiensis TaxID=3073100 RepID=A0ABU4W8J3_9FUSO|nr:ROK family protein [Candidatus Cetobacterium colombiensis]MDX8335837.1 ROK family protein [Candidatus Cetobacterium colombiensis]
MEFKSQNKNITNLLKFINESEGSNKLEIAENIMVSPAALTKISKKLLKDDILLEKKYIDEKNRKKNLLVINYDRFFSIGVLIEKNFTKIILTNLKNDVLGEDTFENNYSGDFEKYLVVLLEFINKIVEKCNVLPEKVLGVGVVVTNEFMVKKSLDLFKEDKFLTLKKEISKKFMGYVFVETEIRAEALYRAFLEPVYKNFFLVKYGEKRGSAIIIDNKLVNPAISHYRSMGTRHFIVEPNSEIYCEICKKKGCFDTMVSPKNIFEEILKENNYSARVENLYKNMSFEEFIKRAESGEITECKSLRKIARYIAILMINHNNLLPLDTFLLSGRIFKSSLFLSYLKMYLQEFQLGEVHEKLIVLEKKLVKEELIASFLPINYIFYNYNFQESSEE